VSRITLWDPIFHIEWIFGANKTSPGVSLALENEFGTCQLGIAVLHDMLSLSIFQQTLLTFTSPTKKNKESVSFNLTLCIGLPDFQCRKVGDLSQSRRFFEILPKSGSRAYSPLIILLPWPRVGLFYPVLVSFSDPPK